MVMYILVASLQCNIFGNLNDDSLEDIYNSDLMKDIRVKMLNDERHEACARCYHQEDSGGHSMRHRANKSWKKHENLIETTQDDGTVKEMKLPCGTLGFLIYTTLNVVVVAQFDQVGIQIQRRWMSKQVGHSYQMMFQRKHIDLWEQIEPFEWQKKFISWW